MIFSACRECQDFILQSALQKDSFLNKVLTIFTHESFVHQEAEIRVEESQEIRDRRSMCEAAESHFGQAAVLRMLEKIDEGGDYVTAESIACRSAHLRSARPCTQV